MRVGLVVYGDLETTSGGFLYDRKLATALRAAGHRVSEVSLPWRDYPRALADSLDPRVRRRLRGFDLLVEDELCHPSLIGHNRAVDAPVVAVVHHLRSSERWPAWQQPVYRAVERRYLRSVDAAIYASEATRRDAERLAGPRPSAVVRPAGDRFDPDVDADAIAARAERESLRICFVGNLVPRKGLHVLLDGLARVPGDWHLSVVGSESADSEYARETRQCARNLGIADGVRFEGRLPDDALADRLAESHLLAVPSRVEGYGVAYLEGMAFGLPALATTAGGAPELVTHGEDGFLVPPGDAAAVAEAVETVLVDRERLREMGIAARRRFERHPSWDESMGKARRFLEAVAEGRESTPQPGRPGEEARQ
ncbi:MULTISPECIES: glycosyltransferase family 4 protein [Halorussus]|uniref:glycosyltransferase family 4 protein n=1 Tax=Halorussus TaxID=1070314 RepID=UPI000E21496A|nr:MULTISPECIES: glycosyltransferase family 4 protein [Halorussus]NHN57606.1 glycosyltransferase family 4 protein [Halorussus sp. JP-T4]